MTALNFDELKDKPKDELDRIKLAQEITAFKEKNEFEQKNSAQKVYGLLS